MRRKKNLLSELKNKLCFALFMLFSTTVIAQETINSPIKWGFEYDLMAPRIGAWNSVNLSAYIGQGRIKHSLIFARININENHLTDESFIKDNLNAFGYRVEIYSHKEMKKWSAGLLMIYSIHNVTTALNKQEGQFNTLFVGVPLGYKWVLWNHLTINPNISILIPLTNRTVKIGIDEVQQAPWGLEPGLRIGYRF